MIYTIIYLTYFIAAQLQHEEDLAEKKRKEYEEWLRTQEMEAYRLEYDCSVKYEEHQSEEKHEEQINQHASSQLSTNLSKITALQHSNL